MPTPTAWHQESPEQALETLESRREGLDPGQARERLARFGPNRLTPPPKRGPLMRFLLLLAGRRRTIRQLPLPLRVAAYR